jgi:hypothetical protein
VRLKLRLSAIKMSSNHPPITLTHPTHTRLIAVMFVTCGRRRKGRFDFVILILEITLDRYEKDIDQYMTSMLIAKLMI